MVSSAFNTNNLHALLLARLKQNSSVSRSRHVDNDRTVIEKISWVGQYRQLQTVQSCREGLKLMTDHNDSDSKLIVAVWNCFRSLLNAKHLRIHLAFVQ